MSCIVFLHRLRLKLFFEIAIDMIWLRLFGSFLSLFGCYVRASLLHFCSSPSSIGIAMLSLFFSYLRSCEWNNYWFWCFDQKFVSIHSSPKSYLLYNYSPWLWLWIDFELSWVEFEMHFASVVWWCFFQSFLFLNVRYRRASFLLLPANVRLNFSLSPSQQSNISR